MPPAPAPVTAAPPPPYHLAKRFVYACDGQLQEWDSAWYTMPFYLDATSFYNSVGQSRNPIAPPPAVVVTRCPGMNTEPPPAPPTPSKTPAPSTTPALTTSAAPSSLAPSPSAPSTAAPLPSTVVPTSTSSRPPTSSVVTSTASSSSATRYSTIYGNPSTSSASAAVTASRALTGGDVLRNADAGHWDATSKAVALTSVLVLAGAMTSVALWVAVKRRWPAVHRPRTWFLSPSQLPAVTTALALVPFLALPSLAAPTSDAHLVTHFLASALGVAAITTVLGLAISLPLFVAGVPHLSSTAPPNLHGGRLNAFTDLSLIRLLEALRPSPGAGSPSALPGAAHRLANLAHVLVPVPGLVQRAAGDGAPVTASARTRLIVLCVLTALLWVGGTLFIVSRAYARVAAYRRTVDDASAGQDIIFLSAANAPGLARLTESNIERRLQDVLPVDDRGPSVVGVFSVGNTTTVKALVSERKSILEVLEKAEAHYINSFPLFPTDSQGAALVPRRSLQRSTPGHNSISSRGSLPQSWAFATFPDAESSVATDARGSAFLEVTQRRSVTFEHGPFSVGQRVIRDHDGTFVPAPGTVEDDLGDADTFETYPGQGSQDALDTRPQVPDDALSVPTSALPPLELARLRGDVVWSRIRITKLTTQIGAAQRQAMSSLARGEGAIGWIIVGRGLKSIPYAEVIEGRTKEDIQWTNLGHSRSERGFWYKTTAVSLGVAFLLIPFSSLSLAAAPGFAEYLGFLGHLAYRNDIGAGLAQTLVPAIVVFIFFGVALGVINRLAVELRLASYTRQTALALKGSVYLISIVGGLWLIVSNTFKYPLQAYAAHSGVGRALADGLVFSACLPLVVLILLVTLPLPLLVQPLRLIRYLMGYRASETPRERFRLNYPPNFSPTITLAPVIAAIIFAQTLAGLRPLVVIPALVVAYLSLVVHHRLTTKVYCLTRGGVSDGTTALWLIRRLGWTVVFPPLLFGLVVLSRKEWGIGAASIGVAAVALAASEYLTIGRHPSPKSSLVSSPDFGPQGTYTALSRHRAPSGKDSSLAPGSSVTTQPGNARELLPGLSRLAWDNPLPFATEAIDDMVSTERASRATPELNRGHVDTAHRVSIIVSQENSSRGLLYPPELLVGSPDVWLPADEHGVAEREVESLAAAGLVAIIDPVDVPPSRRRTLSYRPQGDGPPPEGDGPVAAEAEKVREGRDGRDGREEHEVKG
ncbi:hypothetical protein Q8F55_005278 [Vanrija albida]|uniref:CSC1/OSCA1-like 7TM region domain-containing protein n=1 Tax=Vanrija albida TaxID=181172 RepID=A0ABR3Q1V5_9TREE